MNFSVEGVGQDIIFLHGWGCNKDIFRNISKELKGKYKVYLLDLPGFGKSKEPDEPYNLDNYVEELRLFVVKCDIVNPIIVGHSFGGRIGIRYATKYNVNKLILIDSAGILHYSIKKTYSIYKYKLLKKIYSLTSNISKLETLLQNSGSKDYLSSTNVMKKTLSLIVNTNQAKELCLVKCETLLLWGRHDDVTPFKDGVFMEKKLSNSALILFDDSGHFPFIDEEYKFICVLKSYLQIGEI